MNSSWLLSPAWLTRRRSHTSAASSPWQKAGVRGLADIKDLDAKRTAAREESGESREKRLQKYDSGVSSARQGSGARKNSSNQFHNFKQRDTDYDALVLKQVKEWVGQQP